MMSVPPKKIIVGRDGSHHSLLSLRLGSVAMQWYPAEVFRDKRACGTISYILLYKQYISQRNH